MTEKQLLEEIDNFIAQIKEIPAKRNYWLVRTQAGQFYNSFRTHNFVAIEHEKISLYEINQVLLKNKDDKKSALNELKANSKIKYPDDKPGIIAGQIYKFVVELKKGDLVIIPSSNSDIISIGEVTSSTIPELTQAQLTKTECDYKKRKTVKWLKDISRDSLDPYLYKMLQAHQAINNITAYGDIVERTIGNFYIRENEANLVLQVEQNEDINARQLFNLGHYLLEYSQSFIDNNNLHLITDEIEVKINLNSKGKIQFKAPNPRTLWLIALLAVSVTGGGLKVSYGGFNFDLSTDGIIKKVIDYQNNKHDRNMVDTLSKSMDSLKVLPPTDALKVLKQFSPNKDLPK